MHNCCSKYTSIYIKINKYSLCEQKREIKFKHKFKIRMNKKNTYMLDMLIQDQYFITSHEICCNILLKHVTIT